MQITIDNMQFEKKAKHCQGVCKCLIVPGKNERSSTYRLEVINI